jgi:porin
MIKILKSIIILCFIYTPCQAQGIKDAFEFNLNVTGDFTNNLSGGLSQGYTYVGMEQASLNFNFETAGLWKGANLFIHGINTHGLGPTQTHVGDLMVLSNIEVGDFTGLYEFYYTLELNKLFILLGQHDLNTEFMGSKYGENFINSSFGVINNVLLNVPLSIYPVAAPCVLLKYNVSENLAIKIATYDGNPGNITNNKFNLQWNFSSEEGAMNIFETSYTFIDHEQKQIQTSNGIKMGVYKLGFYYHTGKFINYSDTLKPKWGNYGFYLIMDQMIIPKPSDPQEGLAAMLQLGYSPSKYNRIDNAIEGGIRYYGLFNKRNHDIIGIAFSYAGLGNEFININPSKKSSETALEFTYKFNFNNKVFIQPDIQYIINPGAEKGINNSCTALIRFQLFY